MLKVIQQILKEEYKCPIQFVKHSKDVNGYVFKKGDEVRVLFGRLVIIF